MAKRFWQRGAADLVSLMAGMTILSIVVAGTAASMIYGREALLREEHYKAAAYLLRGWMEHEQGKIHAIPTAVERMQTTEIRIGSFPLDLSSDREGNILPVVATVFRAPVQLRNLPETAELVDWYQLTMRVIWTERDYAESRRNRSGITRSISFTTSFVTRNLI